MVLLLDMGSVPTMSLRFKYQGGAAKRAEVVDVGGADLRSREAGYQQALSG